MKKIKFKIPWGIDWALYAVPILLSILGIVIIFSVTFSSKPFFMISQIIYVLLGFTAAVLLTFFDYRNLRGISLFLYLILIVLLILVLLFGDTAYGSARWIDLKVFQLQPSEIGKLIILLFLARIFSEYKNISLRHIFLALLIVLLPIILIMRQPDLGTSVVIFFEFLVLVFFSNIKKIAIASIIIGLIFLMPVGWYFLKDYQKQRVYTFINPASDPYGAGYNVTQAKITVGSGGLWGQGIGQGTQIQLNFLPVAHTDFIFASTAEAIGFVGSAVVIILLIFLCARVINVAKVSKDLFGFYFALGWGFTLLFEVLINVGMNLGIMPVTGITLPFVSHGGSSMLTNMAAIGILQSIYLRQKKITF